jgi:S1-C subfamily serine protease
MLLVVLLFGALTSAEPGVDRQQVEEAIASALASVTSPPGYAQTVFERVQPSLVLIRTNGVSDDEARGGSGNEGGGQGGDGDGGSGDGDGGSGDGDEAPDEDPARPYTGLGSGVIVNQRGDILTSLHVVDGATKIDITFADGTTSAGEIIATEPDDDIAVIRATDPPPVVIPATLGNPNAVRQGSEAYALGSPFGLYGSVSAGIISGLDRSFTPERTGRPLDGLIQIDTAVNPGNSGGALVDRDGRLIGIVTALINPTGDEVFVGIGLAVPIDIAGGAVGLPPY